MNRRRILLAAGAGTLAATVALVVVTLASLKPIPPSLQALTGTVSRAQVVDRNGRPLSVTYENAWNLHDRVPLHEIPALLQQAFVVAEDGRFFDHHGVDWRARAHAAVQNVRAGRAVRGASTITEQVVRMLHPRPRSLWSRWLEGFEAARLERRVTKGEILEFYLNQVPYARRRRGVVQAARDCFDRDLDTLHPRESLALAVLVRSPGRLDPHRSVDLLDAPIGRLAQHMYREARLSADDLKSIGSATLVPRSSDLAVQAPHLVRHVRHVHAEVEPDRSGTTRIETFLDPTLQQRAEALLKHQIQALAHRDVSDGAVLVVDHLDNEVLAWVNAGGFSEAQGSQLDAVLARRQPGSTLKPFVYALALEQGWTAASMIDDAPMAAPVGGGMHHFRNYSRSYHGPLRLREALGNSLNVPAVRTVQAVSPAAFLRRLRDLGFDSLDRHPDVYGEGLVLGNGEVTLFELVGAYAVLARGGVRMPLRAFVDDRVAQPAGRRLFSGEVSALIADILSDADARRIEFGRGGVLELPVQTAVKTGTSNDYRDAWAVGFSDRHTVGVWMGNLDRREMQGITGAFGPALVLRSIFAELRRGRTARPLVLSRTLRRVRICRRTGGLAGPRCPVVEEWFRQEQFPRQGCALHGPRSVDPQGPAQGPSVRLARPTPGLHLAMDPRIPDELEAFAFEIDARSSVRRVQWLVDGLPVAITRAPRYSWRLARGRHMAQARVWLVGFDGPIETPRVAFLVK